MTPNDRALPRRQATHSAEILPPAAGFPAAARPTVDVNQCPSYVGIGDEVPGHPGGRARRSAGATRRPVTFRLFLVILFVGGAVAMGFAAGGGLSRPAAQQAAASLPTRPSPLAVSSPPDPPIPSPPDPAEPAADSTTSTAAPETSTTAPPTVPPTSTSTVAPTTTAVPVAKVPMSAPTTVPAKPVAPVTSAAPKPVPPPPPPTTAAPGPAPSSSDAAKLACIRQRESGGNYSIVSANGLYFGAYQFTLSTWNSAATRAGRPDLVGVRPNTASPADQDAVALALLQWQGLAPWGGYCA